MALRTIIVWGMRKNYTFSLEDSLVGALREWISRQTAPPSQSAALEAAIRKLIDREVAADEVGKRQSVK